MFLIIEKKLIIFTAVFTFLAFTFVFGLVRAITVFENKPGAYTVILDAGHGDPDGGAVGAEGTLEKDINLAIVLKAKEIFEAKGIRVILTRMGDSSLSSDKDKTIREKKKTDMKARRAIMEKSKADLFISIHMNSFPNKNANGLHIFYSKNHPELESLADELQVRISEITGAKTHSIKTADEKLFLMKNPPIGAILVECGFISNPDEEKKLKSDEYQNKIAWSIAEAVTEYRK